MSIKHKRKYHIFSQWSLAPPPSLLPQISHSALVGENPGSRRRRAGGPGPRAAPAALEVGAGLESEGRHLVLLVTDEQCEVVQGAANDGVGAVIERLERRYMALPPYKHRRCTGKGRAAAAAVGERRRCCV
jgi:hypothetical protein